MDYLTGHLVGDYLLQTDWQAKNKKKKGKFGWLACLDHCLVWTLSVLLFTGWWQWKIAVLVFLSHIVLDRTNVVSKLLIVLGKKNEQWLMIVCDNTIHLVFLWLIARYFA